MKESGDLWIWVSGALATAWGWLFHLLVKTRGELSGHKLHVAKTYVCKDEMRDIMEEFATNLDKRVDRIEDKLDRLIENRSEGR